MKPWTTMVNRKESQILASFSIASVYIIYIGVDSPLFSYCVKVSQPCLTLWDHTDCSLPGSSVHGVLQARILEWVAIPFSRGSSWPRDWTKVFHIVGRFFTVWATREVPLYAQRSFYSIIVEFSLHSAVLAHLTMGSKIPATCMQNINTLSKTSSSHFQEFSEIL